MPKINKSAEILAHIKKKGVVGINELAATSALLNLFDAPGSKPGLARRRIIDTVSLLARQGFISVGTIDAEKIYKLNLKGKYHLESYLILKGGIPTPLRWDSRWHLITFDIPESKKSARNNLILHLKNQGFVSYAKGLWLYPYNPEMFIRGLGRQLGLEKYLKLLVAVKIEDEKRYKKHFSLAK